jgi:hypothetical protein
VRDAWERRWRRQSVDDVCCTFGKVGEGCVCGEGGDLSGVDPSGCGCGRVGDGGGGGHGAQEAVGEVEEGRGEEGAQRLGGRDGEEARVERGDILAGEGLARGPGSASGDPGS